MPVVPFIPAIIGGAAAIYGAKKSADAVTNAAETQAQSSEEAIALQKQMYEQDRADMAPYRNLGAYSVGALGHLTGMPPTPSTPATAPSSGGAIGPGVPVDTSAKPPDILKDTDTTLPGAQGPRGMPTQAPESRSLRDLGARQQTQSSFVRMRAPNGQEKDVDQTMVDYYRQRGAVVLGGS